MKKILICSGFVGLASQALANPCSTGWTGSCKDPKTAFSCLEKNYSSVSNAINYQYNQGKKVQVGVEGKQLMIQNNAGESQAFPITSSDEAKCLTYLKGDITPFMAPHIIGAYNKKIAELQQIAAKNAQRANAKAQAAQRAVQEIQVQLASYKKEMEFIKTQLMGAIQGKTKLCLEKNAALDGLLRSKYRIEHNVSYGKRSDSYKQEAQAKCVKGIQYGNGGVLYRIETVLPKTFAAELYLTLNPDIMSTLSGQSGSLENLAESHYLMVGLKEGRKFLPTTPEEYNAIVSGGYKEKLEEIDQYFRGENYSIWRAS